jgi:tRNA A-37 threonylcarbamoyl transferase component Bud32/tetratricopeptide (TPR) repeat protein
MKDNPNHEMEEHFRKRNETLSDFYDMESGNISNEEQEALLPILNSLDESENRYTELGPIAEGAEKRISRVYDRRLNRQVAMARSAKTQSSPRDHEQFLREAQLEANLAHPYIVPVYNMGIDPEGIPFFTMELIPGDSLKMVIEQLRQGNTTYKRDYPLNTLLSMYLKICEAMAYAHSRQVLHLDIKPDNIRVGKFGEIFICDWGLAKVLFEDETEQPDAPGKLDGNILNDMTLSGTIKGTPGFMAPEQTEATGKQTVQSDIYALGALLYMLLTYELPVKGRSGNEILENTRNGKIIPVHARKRGKLIPRSLSAVAMKALSPKPEDRYANANEIRQEIQRYLTGFATQAERAGMIIKLSLAVRRHNQVASMALFFLLLITITIGVNTVVIDNEKAVAIAEKKRAEENFRLYREQQQKIRKLDVEISELTSFALKTRDYSKARQKISVLEIALEKTNDPAEKTELLLQKGTMHFVLEQFKKALACFEEAGAGTGTPNDSEIKRLCQKYVRIKSRDQNILSLQQLAQLINDAEMANKATYFLYFHHMKRVGTFAPEQYLPVAVAMLDKLNRLNPSPTDRPLRLSKRNGGYHLDLTQSPYLTYTLTAIGRDWKNILEPFNLHSMDISHLPLRSLSELEALKIQELKMVGLNIGRQHVLPTALNKMEVKKLTIDTNAYPRNLIRKLRQKHRVVNESVTATR